MADPASKGRLFDWLDRNSDGVVDWKEIDAVMERRLTQLDANGEALSTCRMSSFSVNLHGDVIG